MSVFQAIVLGVVQGVTEFLPISSSAHLVLVPWLFGWEDPGLHFDIFLHFGTLFALVGYFFKDWWRLITSGLQSAIDRRIGYDRDRLLFWYIFFATIPAGLAGVLFHEQAETAFRSPLLIAMTLSLVGFLLYWIDGKFPAIKTLENLSFKDAMFIGLAQACAIVPGVSRSGSTMAMGRLCGLSRESTARFSFLMSLPIICSACLFSGKKMLEMGAVDFFAAPMVAGFFASAITGLISIHFLLRWLRVANFALFGWYRILVAAIIVILSMLR